MQMHSTANVKTNKVLPLIIKTMCFHLWNSEFFLWRNSEREVKRESKDRWWKERHRRRERGWGMGRESKRINFCCWQPASVINSSYHTLSKGRDYRIKCSNMGCHENPKSQFFHHTVTFPQKVQISSSANFQNTLNQSQTTQKININIVVLTFCTSFSMRRYFLERSSFSRGRLCSNLRRWFSAILSLFSACRYSPW